MMSLPSFAISIVWFWWIPFTTAERQVNKQCGLTVPSTVTTRSNKILIAHRGASFHLPEHTLESYELALELGADYIEPDLVATKDGVLIACHSADLNITTNVARVFPKRTSFSSFANRTGYWVFDFKYAEIKKLRVKQRVPNLRTTLYDGLFPIPSLQEILQLLDTWNTKTLPQLTTEKKRAGLYVELKDPKWFEQDANLHLPDLLLDELESSSYKGSIFNDTDCASLEFNEYLVPPMVVQCFDGEALKSIYEGWTSRAYGVPPPMVLLGADNDCLEDDWWYKVGEWTHFLHGVGPDKNCFPKESEARSFMELSREHELAVHVWTERPEPVFLLDGFDNVDQELLYLSCDIGVDGFFTEDVARTALTIAKGCSELAPTLSPSTSAAASAADQCADSEADSNYLAMASGIMGLLVGIISTMFLMNSRHCKSRRHTRRQLRIPTHEDVEMI